MRKLLLLFLLTVSLVEAQNIWQEIPNFYSHALMEIAIDLSRLQNGIYVAKITNSAKETTTVKILKN